MPKKREPNEFKVDSDGCIKLLASDFYLSDKLEGKKVKIYIDKFTIYAVGEIPTVRYALIRRKNATE